MWKALQTILLQSTQQKYKQRRCNSNSASLFMLWCGSKEVQSALAANKNMRLNINEIKQARCHYITMGRGRKGVINQGN